MLHGQYADGSLVVHPVTSENIPGRTLVVVLAPELQQDQTVYVLSDAGSVLDSSAQFPRGLVNSDSNFAVAERVLVPNGTVTFPVGEVSTTTTIVISFTVSVPLAGENTHLVGPGDSEIGVNLAFSQSYHWRWGTFHLAFNTDALPLSSTGHVALARPASINVVALHSKEPLEDLLIPHNGSTTGVHGDFALCFIEGVVASTSWSKEIRIIVRSREVAILFGESGRVRSF